MKLQIIITQKTSEQDIDWIELNTPAIHMVIEQGHAPMIIELSSGFELMYQLHSGATESMMIVQGVVHVTRQDVKILLPMDL
jgi:F0F1-type ATP synthase epsilon subunit